MKDQLNIATRTAIWGNTKSKIQALLPWTGNNQPNMEWLAKSFEHLDSVAKEHCTGCGWESEVKESFLNRIFSQFKPEEDWKKINWSKKFLHWTKSCELCSANDDAPNMVELVIEEINK